MTAFRRRWVQAGIASAATFAAAFLLELIFVLALIGPARLQQPIAFGLTGPMPWPGLAIAALMTGIVFTGLAIDGLIDLKATARDRIEDQHG